MNIVCIIDVASREVTLRDQYRIAAYDHNVDVIQFSLEPVEDFAFDLSSIKIAAQGPNKARHDYAVDPSTVQIEEETGYITFDWPIPAGVTEMPIGSGFKYGDKGQLIFAVCAEIISGSTLSKAWHSDDGIITVVAHLEPESGGGEDPEEEATNAQKIGQLQTDVAVINTQVGALANGSPTPVATVAEMTDESAVYLYTGSESGYTAGNWYYYDGTEWTSGGAYGGATTSTTFNQHGVPADDFAVGEALADKADADDVDALDTRVTAVEGDVSDLITDLGDLNSLVTTDKTSIVNAINEAASTGNGLDEEAQELLMDILRNAIYASDQSENIDALEYNLSGGLQKYNITYNLINSSSSNTKTRISESKSYTTTITAQSGYSLLSVTVTMGGTDITSTAYSNGVVTIAEVTGDIVISATSDEAMTLLRSVNLANGAYIDTEYVPASLDDQIIIGVMLMGDVTPEKPFAGVTRLPSSTIAAEEYTEYVWQTGSSAARISAKVGAYKNPSIVITTLLTVNGNYEPYDEITSVPFYFSIKNGEQKLRANMDLTESLVTNNFNIVDTTQAYTSTAAMPIDSIYLGAVHDAGSKTTPNQYTAGVKFYGFRVYDANGDLAVDMKPAIRGSSIGMYDMARGKFYTATNGTVGTDITYDEVSA